MPLKAETLEVYHILYHGFENMPVFTPSEVVR